jgi:hypothetical protein
VHESKKRRTADLATEQQTASRPEQDLTAEVKIKQLRQLFADAPEVGKTRTFSKGSRRTRPRRRRREPAGNVSDRTGLGDAC